MSADTASAASNGLKSVGVIGIILMVAGIIMVFAGGATYALVSSTLRDQRITTSPDTCLAGQTVAGPFTAYCEAMIIETHALKATGGKTYAELAKDDPLRQVAMTASFLRASLFTSVVAFGVAALAMALGLLMAAIGFALQKVAKGPNGSDAGTVAS